jgi:hypothetical protein
MARPGNESLVNTKMRTINSPKAKIRHQLRRGETNDLMCRQKIMAGKWRCMHTTHAHGGGDGKD